MAKKLVDTWKAKSWYHVNVPKFLGQVEVTQVPANEPETLVNRVLEIPLKDVTKDYSHIYTTIRLRVFEVKGKTADTKFIGHHMAQEYIRNLVRRRREVINIVLPVKSQDGVDFTIKVIAVTNNTCSEKQKKAVRMHMEAQLKAMIAERPFGDFINDVLWGRIAAKLYEQNRKIYPLRKVEVRKTVLKEEFDTEEKKDISKQAEESVQPSVQEAQATSQ